MKNPTIIMKRFLFCVVIMGTLALSGCTSLGNASRAPSWIDHLYDRSYNEKTYLCAIGSGSSREMAVDAAFSSLSQVFNSKVKSITTVSSLSTSEKDTSGSVVFTDSSTMLDQGTISSSTDIIIGAEVVNTYMDEQSRVYVRVALHRNRTVVLYKDDIAELATSIARLKVQSKTANSKLASYFILRKAYGLAQRQQGLIDQMEVLTKKQQSSILPELERQLNALASDITIVIHTQIDITDEDQKILARKTLSAAFGQELLALGFKVVQDGSHPTADLDVHYQVMPISMEGSPYQYARYELSAELSSADHLLLSYQKTDREAALSTQDAMAKALKQASLKASKSLLSLMEQKFGAME
ncbi:LPP20 family lipoprotein [uncultured Sphaerochaeta sp.]|uniref:LPP20 family lipoprotein n=1 Tax=uncultured Sphaerochaeta sp. TaxID=886478 RepID=UPI002A0A432E|nr:LPP20 family lipoprotein [uncultured Sphaerochaeta sp.]